MTLVNTVKRCSPNDILPKLLCLFASLACRLCGYNGMHVPAAVCCAGTAAVPDPPPELQLEGTTVLSSNTPRSKPGSASLTIAPGWESSRAAVSLATAPSREQGRAARIGSRRSSGRSGGRPLNSCSGRRPLRLQADARSGRIMLVGARLNSPNARCNTCFLLANP